MTDRHTIDQLLARARARLERVAPEDLAAEASAGALVVDVRPADQRARDGDLPGAIVVDRNVLEWRLDPASPHRIAEATGYDQRIILVCNEGYSSSLAAATLQDLGLRRATDLIGGYQAWRAGAPEPRPDERLDPNLDIVIDCADPQGLAAFWAAALGYRAVGFREPHLLLLPAQRAFPPLILQRVPEPKHGKARIHFDVRVAVVEAEVRRLEALGARRIDVGQGDEVDFVPMADPEGNEFCVCPGAPLDF